MSNRYIPHTDADKARMLERIGVGSVDELYNDVPQQVVFQGEYDLPEGMSEPELREWFAKLGAANNVLKVFGGNGAYDHYSPSVISHLLERSEFYTAYTPYQPEISQGTLQYIFEYQSMISELTGMESANASMYDGATAAAESMFMMVSSARKKNRVLVSATLLPQVRRVIATYMKFHGVELTELPAKDGVTDFGVLDAELAKGDVAGVMVPSVNRYGIVEDLTGVADRIHAAKGALAVYCDPSALAVLKTPGEWDADIACGDGQTLGMPLQFGGPYLGFIACRKDMLRKMPGRVVGATVDRDGKRCYVLTLQAREQHIRRQKATSNICSNQSLMALYATVYVALMGPEGLKEVNSLSCDGAHYLYNQLLATGKFHAVYDKPFLKEFVVKTDLDVKRVNKYLADHGYMGGVEIEPGVLEFAVTEKRTKVEIDTLVKLMLEA